MHYVGFQLVSYTYFTPFILVACVLYTFNMTVSLFVECRLQHTWPRIDVHRMTHTPPVRVCSLPSRCCQGCAVTSQVQGAWAFVIGSSS